MFPCAAWGQDSPGAYLIPQTVFVGDRGRLVAPLGKDCSGAEPFIREEGLPQGEHIRILRVELERRNGEARLLIDFIPYTPGLIVLPPLEIGSSLVEGLSVRVASILENSSMTLSESAPPLVLPGTSLLLYGVSSVVLVLLFLGIGGWLWGRRHLGGVLERHRRRRLLRGMERLLKRLGEEEQRDSGPLVSKLSGEFRRFLSLYTGINCLSLSSPEFGSLPDYGGLRSLGPLFSRWDTLRFSGRAVLREDLASCIEDVLSFIEALKNTAISGSIEQ